MKRCRFGVPIDVSMKGDEASNDHDDEIELSLRLERVSIHNSTVPLLQQVRPPNETETRKQKKKREHKKRRVAEIQEPDTSIPPQLLEEVKSREGTTDPIFLYQKMLSQSDADKTLSRLFVLEKEGFERMLTDDESRILKDTGLENIVCVDTRGRLYNLGLTVRSSLKMLVINSEWSKLVKQNDAKEDDWVQIWGHRDHMGNLCMAINFKKA